jgi:2-polyprenyl-3-methyl-5-hydroxy-6-metoxy-1,4-benzoquinol methylase
VEPGTAFKIARGAPAIDWPADGLEGVSACPVCGCDERSRLHSDLQDCAFGVAPGNWSLFRCTGCASAWLDPRPTQSTIGLAYKSYYTHRIEDHSLVRRKGALRTFVHDALNGYRNARHGLRREPAMKSGRWLIPLIPSLRAAVDAECRHLPMLPDHGGRLLDVGFGNGAFLKLAAEIGWSAEGIDFDPAAVEAAKSRGLNVRCAGVEELVDEPGSYDVITLSHVIEHVYDPPALLRAIYRLLRPGGLLWLETPNLDSLGHARFGRNWRGLEPPRHLTLFCVDSLKSALTQAGFTRLRQYWRGLSVFDVLPASEAIRDGHDPQAISREGKPPLREIVAELHEMLVPRKREFLTFIARKSARTQ